MSQYIYSPFNGMSQLQRELGRFFEPALSGLTSANHPLASQEDWSPEVDIMETAEGYQLLVDLPGIDPADVDITVDKNLLSIRGSRTNSPDLKEKGYKRRERVVGSFSRQFTLSDSADSENINAKSNHGVLEINIPKHTKSPPINIAVES
jgi:HSP20 family protein